MTMAAYTVSSGVLALTGCTSRTPHRPWLLQGKYGTVTTTSMNELV